MATAQELMAALHASHPYNPPVAPTMSMPSPTVTMPAVPPAKVPTQANAGAILAALQAANPSGIRSVNPKLTAAQPAYASLPNGAATPTGVDSLATLQSQANSMNANRTAAPNTLLTQLKATPQTARAPSALLAALQAAKTSK